MTKWHKFFKLTSGSVAVEFGLLLPLLFLVFSGIANIGLILIAQNKLNEVVAAGTMYAFGNSSNLASVSNAMQNATTLSPLVVTPGTYCQCLGKPATTCSSPTPAPCSTGAQPSVYVTVSASTSVPLIAPDFLPPLANPFPLTTEAVIRTER